MKKSITNKRKSDHLQITLQENVSSSLSTGLEKLHFSHQALPEINYDEVDPSLEFLGKKLSFPLLISSMTGGTPEAGRINRNLALAAEKLNVGLALGSQRAAIEDPAQADSFRIRDLAPSAPLFANLGAVQLNYGFGLEECQRAVDMIQADGLILHLNPLQEVLQPEGETNFRGILTKIRSICRKLEHPVIVKEVGFGISPRIAKRLYEAGVWAVDVAGAGGTSWSQVEKFRAKTESDELIAESFHDWGISTAESLRTARRAALKLRLIASGGIRSGVDMAKCITLGAELCGIAIPFLKAATISSKSVENVVEVFRKQFRVAMFVSGVACLNDLSKIQLLEN